MPQRDFFVDSNLHFNQLLQALVENVTTLPVENLANQAGRIVYLTTDKLLYKCNGERWIKIPEYDDVIVTLNKTFNHNDSGFVYILRQGGKQVGVINVPKEIEVVSSLPTTELFAGRQVMYNGQLYVYNGSQWVNVNAPYEANLQWGGDNFSDGYSPIDAGLVPALRANRIAFLPPENIDVEYSRDGGDTWLIYDDANIDRYKRRLTSSSNALIAIGYYTSDNTQPTADYQLRVTINAGTQVYSVLHKLVVYYSTYNSQNVILTVSASKTGSTDFVELTNSKLTGFPGYSVLNFDKITMGNRTNNYDRLRLTFTSSGSNQVKGLLLQGLELYGGVGWFAPSNLAKIGTIYSFDEYGNVEFPAVVKSTETVNFDANIKPTQTGVVAKTSVWLWQYYAQSIAWLVNNHLPLSGGTLSGEIKAPQFIVPNGTAAQFLKADGSLDSNAYALHTDLNAVKNNAWKLDEANAEVSTVVVTLQGNMSVFAAMDKAGINYQTSRNIYVDMSKADFIITDIFAGFENLPVGIRYHIFFGNTKNDCKIYWNESKVESNLVSVLGITPAYPTAKCEFMRVTEAWTYADWEAKVENVSHTIDTGTASESDNSTLMNYMDNNKVSYTNTTKGALVNITALLAALAGSK